jgi:hypothetical protein
MSELSWFNEWTSVVEKLLKPYKYLISSVGYRAIEIQEFIEYALCTHLLKHAMRYYPQAWENYVLILGDSPTLEKALNELFGQEIPLSVARMALNLVADQSEEFDESPAITIGRKAKREHKNKQDISQFVWIVRIVGNTMTVSVENRTAIQDGTVGLIKVVDAR